MEQNKKAKRVRQTAILVAVLLAFFFGMQSLTGYSKEQQTLETVVEGDTPLAAPEEETLQPAATPLAAEPQAAVTFLPAAAQAQSTVSNADTAAAQAALAQAKQNDALAKSALDEAKQQAAQKKAALEEAQNNKGETAQQLQEAKAEAEKAAAAAKAAEEAAQKAADELEKAKAAYEKAQLDAANAQAALAQSQQDLAKASQSALVYESLQILNQGITESDLNALSQQMKKKDFFEWCSALNSTGKNFASTMNDYYESKDVLPSGQEYTYRIALLKDGSYNIFLVFDSVTEDALKTPVADVVCYNTATGAYTLGDTVVAKDNDNNKVLDGAAFAGREDVSQIAADALAEKASAKQDVDEATQGSADALAEEDAKKQAYEAANADAAAAQSAADAAAQQAQAADAAQQIAQENDDTAALEQDAAQQENEKAQEVLEGAQANADAAGAVLQQAENQ